MILMLEKYNTTPSLENIRYVWMYEPRFPHQEDANSVRYALKYSSSVDTETYVAAVDNYVLSLQ